MKTHIYNFLEKRFGFSIRRRKNARLLDRDFLFVALDRDEPDYDDAWILALGANARIVFDVGANIGKSAFLILYANKVEELFLIDPNPLALSIAAENMIRNNLSRHVRFISAFISDAPNETLKFYTVGSGAAGSMYKSHAKTAGQMNAFLNVQTSTLDSLADEYKVIPDLVKIDVEGAEAKVLRGAVGLAKHQQTKFMVEVHSSPELSIIENTNQLLSWCESSEYTAWYLRDKVVLTNAEHVKNRGRYHLLLLPKRSPFPDYLLDIEQRAPLSKGITMTQGGK